MCGALHSPLCGWMIWNYGLGLVWALGQHWTLFTMITFASKNCRIIPIPLNAAGCLCIVPWIKLYMILIWLKTALTSPIPVSCPWTGKMFLILSIVVTCNLFTSLWCGSRLPSSSYHNRNSEYSKNFKFFCFSDNSQKSGWASEANAANIIWSLKAFLNHN